MPQQRIEVHDAAERRFVEQVLALFREVCSVARQAPDGEVLDQAEVFVVRQGREWIRQGLQSVLQKKAHELDKEGPSARSCAYWANASKASDLPFPPRRQRLWLDGVRYR